MDVRLFQAENGDGGEVTWVNGEPVTSEGLETAAYLSLFGGNERDSGLTDGDAVQWWANFEEPVAARRQRSQLQSLLRGMPAVPANLKRAEDAASSDLAWMVQELKAKVDVEASMPGVDKLDLSVAITIGDTRYRPFKFSAPWSSS